MGLRAAGPPAARSVLPVAADLVKGALRQLDSEVYGVWGHDWAVDLVPVARLDVAKLDAMTGDVGYVVFGQPQGEAGVLCVDVCDCAVAPRTGVVNEQVVGAAVLATFRG